ncbi:hypothetical protein [Sulfuracidifex tepidarius]|uniref:Uncharacterized protein n=1 Tax=Sulfuracidifex tepidarius TaxID=1294262 RepID=A0A510DZE4_9CREN|nr:hypothetical protein [Sulfuracidifex tepidarius]BBG25611.1 hypothetical protein IC007_0116 [Sulfuracidifex tepidarius]
MTRLPRSRGISTSISVLILLVVVLSIGIPFLFYLEYSSQYSQVSSAISNNYVTLKGDQYKNVLDGKPAILYSNASLVFQFVNGTFSSQTSFTIKKVLQFTSSGFWQEIPSACVSFENGTKEYINLEGLTVNTGTQIQFKDLSGPVAIVTTLGNVFYLTPESSIGPYVSVGKGGFTIISQAVSKQGLVGIQTTVVSNIKGAYADYKTPVTFANLTGSFVVNEPEQYVYFTNASGIYTAEFHNWYVIGNALVTALNSTAVRVTLEGSSAVLVSNYTVLTSKVTVDIVNKYYSETGSVYIDVDGHEYEVGSSLPVQVRAGYVNITAITTSTCLKQDNGEEKSYFNFSNFTYNGVTYKGTEALILIPPTSSSSTVYLNYYNGVNCFQVTIVQKVYNNGYPNNVSGIEPQPSEYPEEAYFNGTGYSLNSIPNTFWLKQGNYSIIGTGNVERGNSLDYYIVCYNDHTYQYFSEINWMCYYVQTSSGEKVANGYYYVDSPVTLYFYYYFGVGYNPIIGV